MKTPKRVAIFTTIIALFTIIGLYMSISTSSGVAQLNHKYPRYIPDSSKSLLFNKAQLLVFKSHNLVKHLQATSSQQEVAFGNFIEKVIDQNSKIDYRSYPVDGNLAEQTIAFFLKYKTSQKNTLLWESIAKSNYITLEGKQAQLKKEQYNSSGTDEDDFWRLAIERIKHSKN